MLVITRCTDESVKLTSADGTLLGIIIVVSVSASGQVRLGFDFPRTTQIDRDNVRKSRPNGEAGDGDGAS